jgi:hypothetical protein
VDDWQVALPADPVVPADEFAEGPLLLPGWSRLGYPGDRDDNLGYGLIDPLKVLQLTHPGAL